MSPDEAREFVAAHSRGVLATVKRSDGRPQLSIVGYAADGDRLRASVTDDRAKTANLRHDPRASLLVASEDLWTYVVAEGRASLSPVAAAPDDATAAELLEVYELIAGPHPDPREFGEAMVAERRLVLTLDVARYYPAG